MAVSAGFARDLAPSKLTSGMQAIALALSLCGQLSLFGFDSHEDYVNISAAVLHRRADPVHPYHYFDAQRPGSVSPLGPMLDSDDQTILRSGHVTLRGKRRGGKRLRVSDARISSLLSTAEMLCMSAFSLLLTTVYASAHH